MIITLMHVLDSTTQTPDTVERRKLAIVQEILYGQDKVYEKLIKTSYLLQYYFKSFFSIVNYCLWTEGNCKIVNFQDKLTPGMKKKIN